MTKLLKSLEEQQRSGKNKKLSFFNFTMSLKLSELVEELCDTANHR